MSEFFIRKDGESIDLERVLNHETARKAYLEYSKGVYANENVEFWQAVDALERTSIRLRESEAVFKAINMQKQNAERAEAFLKKTAKWIIETWVTDEAENEVSMSYEVKQELLERYENDEFSFDMFTEAKIFVIQLMSSNYNG